MECLHRRVIRCRVRAPLAAAGRAAGADAALVSGSGCGGGSRRIAATATPRARTRGACAPASAAAARRAGAVAGAEALAARRARRRRASGDRRGTPVTGARARERRRAADRRPRASLGVPCSIAAAPPPATVAAVAATAVAFIAEPRDALDHHLRAHQRGRRALAEPVRHRLVDPHEQLARRVGVIGRQREHPAGREDDARAALRERCSSRSADRHGAAVAQVRAQRDKLVGTRLAVDERRQQRRPALALVTRLDSRVAREERAAPLVEAAVHLRPRPPGDLLDLVVAVALGLQPQRADLLRLAAARAPRRRDRRARSRRRAPRATARCAPRSRRRRSSAGPSSRWRARRTAIASCLTTVRSHDGARSGSRRGGVAQEDLQAALVGVVRVVGADAVTPRQAKQPGGVLLHHRHDHRVELLARQRPGTRAAVHHVHVAPRDHP